MSELKKKKKTSQIFLYLPIFFTLVFTTSLFLESSHTVRNFHKVSPISSTNIKITKEQKKKIL